LKGENDEQGCRDKDADGLFTNGVTGGVLVHVFAERSLVSHAELAT
jgi:hypothetical protein